MCTFVLRYRVVIPHQKTLTHNKARLSLYFTTYAKIIQSQLRYLIYDFRYSQCIVHKKAFALLYTTTKPASDIGLNYFHDVVQGIIFIKFGFIAET